MVNLVSFCVFVELKSRCIYGVFFKKGDKYGENKKWQQWDVFLHKSASCLLNNGREKSDIIDNNNKLLLEETRSAPSVRDGFLDKVVLKKNIYMYIKLHGYESE